jgi:uncharacterized protein DUF6855
MNIEMLFSSIMGRRFEVSQHELPDQFTSVHIRTFLCVTQLWNGYEAIRVPRARLCIRAAPAHPALRDWADTGRIGPSSGEAWGRSPSNPVGGWYGLKKGFRGRFGVYLPPLLEELGLVELEHNAKNNRVRAKSDT